ncbi:P-loop NTPase fold protein [Enterococcus faecium]|nr:P-loop NTPase fold protein [Enterococcus hirae]MCR1913680.1 KAP family NTPase [Enterococcus hirae]QQU12308.1 hypothetical protein I6I82_00285 [Enterococcus hirae]
MNHLQDIVENYLKTREPYAIQIDGKWGVGKTYYIKKYLIPKLKDKNYVVYFSIYGYDSLEQIKNDLLSNIISELHPSSRHINNLIKKNEGLFDLVNKLGNERLKSFSSISYILFNLLQEKYYTPELTDKSKSLIIFIDDLERVSRSIQLSDLLGFIGAELLDKLQCKVIILSNSSEIKRSYLLKKIKEKTISRTIEFNYDISFIENEIFKKSKNEFIQKNSSWICDILKIIHQKEEQGINLRILNSIIENYIFIEEELKEEIEKTISIEDQEDVKKSIFLNLFVITNEYKLGTISSNNMTILSDLQLNINKLNMINIDGSSDTEKIVESISEKYHHKTTSFENYIYYSKNITNFVLTGYLEANNYSEEWKSHFRPNTVESPLAKVNKLNNFRNMTDLELEKLQLSILEDIQNYKYDLDDLITAYGQLEQFKDMELFFLPENYIRAIEEHFIQLYKQLDDDDILTRHEVYTNHRIDLKTKNPELVTKLKKIDEEVNMKNSMAFLEGIFEENYYDYFTLAQRVLNNSDLDLYQIMIENNFVERYIVINQNKSDHLSSIIRGGRFPGKKNQDTIKKFRDDIFDAYKNDSLGKIDTFNIKQLLDELDSEIERYSIIPD